MITTVGVEHAMALIGLLNTQVCEVNDYKAWVGVLPAGCLTDPV